jgi:hypothetical protein
LEFTSHSNHAYSFEYSKPKITKTKDYFNFGKI